MKIRELRAIFDRHQLNPKFWEEFKALVLRGTPPSAELKTRLNHVDNYIEALADVLIALSKPYEQLFSPVTQFESLEHEECFA